MRLKLLFFVCFCSQVSGRRLTATEVQKALCPHCQEIQHGDFRRFWVVYQLDGREFLTQTSMLSPMELGDYLYRAGDDQLYLAPVFHKSDYQPVVVQVTPWNQLNIMQIRNQDGKYTIADQAFCGTGTRLDIRQNDSFYCAERYEMNPTHAYPLKLMCSPGNSIYMQSESDCFMQRRCICDVDKGIQDDVSGKENLIYQRMGLVVYAGCLPTRCVYFIHDTKTGIDWYIPDTLKFAATKMPGMTNIGAVIPLIEETDAFLSSPRRTTNGSTTTPTTMARTTTMATTTPMATITTTTTIVTTTTTTALLTTTMESPTTENDEEKKDEGSQDNTAIWASLLAVCGFVLIAVIGVGVYLCKREQKKKLANKAAATVSEMSTVSNISLGSMFSVENESNPTSPTIPEAPEQKSPKIERPEKKLPQQRLK